MDRRCKEKSPHTSTYLDIIPLLVRISIDILDHQTLDLVTDGANLGVQVTGLVGGDGTGDDRAGDTSGTTEGHLGGNVDVGNVLVLTEKGQVKDDGKGGGVGSQDNQVGGTTVTHLAMAILNIDRMGLVYLPVQALGGLVSTLLQLTNVTSLLDEVEKGLRQSLVGDGPGYG